GPAATMLDEVPGLGLTAGVVRDGEMVRPPDNPLVVRPDILVVENRIRVVSALGGLGISEINGGRHRSPVDVPLVCADFDSRKLGHGRGGGRSMCDACRTWPRRMGCDDGPHGVGFRVSDLYRVNRSRGKFRLGYQNFPACPGHRPDWPVGCAGVAPTFPPGCLAIPIA